MEASAPLAAHIEPEPPDLAAPGAVGRAPACCAASSTFFFLSFLFAYFYLRSLDTNNSWKIGKVDPTSGVRDRDRRAVRRERGDAPDRRHAAEATRSVQRSVPSCSRCSRSCSSSSSTSRSASARRAAATPACTSGGRPRTRCSRSRASTGSKRRSRPSGGPGARGSIVRVAEGVPADDVELLRAGLEACSFFWAFYVALGVVAFIVLYVV